MTDVAVVFAGGPDPAAPFALPDGAFVVAADGGAAVAAAFGVDPDVLVGDMDSIDAALLERLADTTGTRVERHSVDKDATDVELALDLARARSPGRVLVVGSATGRLDHAYALLQVLAAKAAAGCVLDAVLGRTVVHAIAGTRTLAGAPGELVSLFAALGPATVSCTGLRYPLDRHELRPGTSLGVSNVFEAAEAELSVQGGVVLALRPEAQPAQLFGR